MVTMEVEVCVQQIDDIIEVCRHGNERFGITGLISINRVNRNQFQCVQYFEGNKENAYQLLQNITRDARMKDMNILYQGTLQKRNAQEFSMKLCSFSELRKMLFSLKDVLAQVEYEKYQKLAVNIQKKTAYGTLSLIYE